jgi:chromate transporter
MTAGLPEPEPRPQIPLWTIFTSYFIVGLTAFGMAILQRLKALVIDKHWLSEEEMNEGLALVQLYPGPLMVDFTAYVGYKLRGVPGAVLATLGFVTPSFVLMLILSAAYFAAGSLLWVRPLFLGLEALVVGILVNVTLDMGARALKGRGEAAIALGAFVALSFKVNAILIVLAALVLGALLLKPSANNKTGARAMSVTEPASLKRWIAIAAVIVLVLAAAGFAWALNSDIGRMSLVFFKIGSVAFGNGMTIIPLIQADAVDGHQWLTLGQFADGIALGQITPGPFLITAAFIGYKLGGLLGATLATFAMFSPPFAMTLIFTELLGRLRNLRAIRGALAGVLASFVGLLAVVLLQLGSVGIVGPPSLALAAGAFVGVRYFKWDIVWVFVVGLMLWAAGMALGITGGM